MSVAAKFLFDARTRTCKADLDFSAAETQKISHGKYSPLFERFA